MIYALSFSHKSYRLKDAILTRQLQVSWPDVENGREMVFWAHEWNDHGKCSRNTFGQAQYFQRSHFQWTKGINNITDILEKAHIIVPGNLNTQTRNYMDVENPIRHVTGKIPLLRCMKKFNATSQKLFLMLQEVVLCYDHNLASMIDCNRSRTTCNKPFEF